MSFNFPPNGEEQQLNIIDTTNIDLSVYRLNKDGSYCNCPSKKGPHISEKKGHQFFTPKVTSMPITESVEQGETQVLPLPNQATTNTTATAIPNTNGVALGKPVVTTEPLPVYPDGYKVFNDDSIVIYLPQVSVSDNAIKFQEAGKVDVTKQEDWGALVDKVFIELGSNNGNTNISMLEVTIKPIRN